MSNKPIPARNVGYLRECAIRPAKVDGRLTLQTRMHKRYLYQKLFSVFDFEMPESVDVDTFRENLFGPGSVACINTKQFGWVAYRYGTLKTDFYMHPYLICVNNYLLAEPAYGIVGYNAEVVHCFDDFHGLDDLVTMYAEMLASIDAGINVNVVNSRFAFLFRASDKNEALSLKKAVEEATSGEPAVYVGKDLLQEMPEPIFGNVKNTWAVNDMLEARRTIVNMFLTDIGIRNSNYEKRERLTQMELSENNDETSAIVYIIYKHIEESFKKLEKISGLTWKVSFHYDYTGKEDGGNDVVNALRTN